MSDLQSFQFSETILRETENLQGKLVRYLQEKGWEKITIWGTGKNGQLLSHILNNVNIEIACFYDDNATGTHFSGHPLINPDSDEQLLDCPVVIAINSASGFTQNIEKKLNSQALEFIYFESSQVASNSVEKKESARLSLEGILENLKKNGYTPSTVLDIGAAFGHWTTKCLSVFPDADYFMFEPLEKEYRPFHQNMREKLSPFSITARYVALSDYDGQAVYNMHPDWSSSSLLKEAEGKFVDGDEIKVQCQTLDSALADESITPSILMKIDTQGNELKILKGARKVIEQCSVIILETSFYPFFIGGPQFLDVCQFMDALGYIVHDISDIHYKLLDGSMAQADIVFVSKESAIHKTVDFATVEQRKDKVMAFQHSVQNALQKLPRGKAQ
jgi:FkbM family methyltransferase